MPNTLSHCQSPFQNPALVVTPVSTKRLLRSSNSSPVKKTSAELDVDCAQATTNIEQLELSTTLQCTKSEIALEEKIAKAEGPSHFEGQPDIEDNVINKYHGYIMDIFQLIQTEIAAPAVPTHAKMQSMPINQKINYEANHIFLVQCKLVDAAIEDTFATGQASLRTPMPSSKSSTPPWIKPWRIP